MVERRQDQHRTPEAAVRLFRRLVAHLRRRTDVQNIWKRDGSGRLLPQLPRRNWMKGGGRRQGAAYRISKDESAKPSTWHAL